jgi:dynamin 1-like protein
MIDMVPKAITLTLVNYSKENLQRELLEHLYKPDVLEELLKESPDVVARWVMTLRSVRAVAVAVLTGCLLGGRSASRWSARSTRPRLSSRRSRRVIMGGRGAITRGRGDCLLIPVEHA